MKKYELIKETKTCSTIRIMYRIRALKDFSDIKAGDVGGWVCSENNLSQEGDCWIYDDAKCLDNAKMFDNAKMYDNAIMCNNAVMCNNAEMYGNAEMYDNAILDKDKILYGSINKSYKKIFQYHCEKRLLTAILTEVNEILYSVGCQIGMTKEKFIDRIYNDCEVRGKGLEEYPHRQEYLDIIGVAESYLKKFI